MTGMRAERRRGAGNAAMTAPIPITSPPSQSHETRGMTRMRIVAQLSDWVHHGTAYGSIWLQISITPKTKPSTASLKVVQICSQIEP